MKKNKDNKKKLKDMEKQANEDMEQTQGEVVDEKKNETSATEDQHLETEEESLKDETEKNKGLGKSKKDKRFEKMAEEKAELEEKLSASEKLASENKDKYLRMFSEFDNYKKRVAREKIELIDSASEGTIKKLLPVLDDIDRANEMMDKATDVQAVKDGCNLIFDKIKNILTSCGLAEMETTGEDFDADKHEAITQLPAASEDQKNKIIDTTKKGYTLNGKIIRFAQVVVGC
ncbi:MAG: nucleotide exchange factor GrpE [Bacteroidales bacterium]|nr:nucleotide exchange factor GrpE [Bacteroidales bacterium]